MDLCAVSGEYLARRLSHARTLPAYVQRVCIMGIYQLIPSFRNEGAVARGSPERLALAWVGLARHAARLACCCSCNNCYSGRLGLLYKRRQGIILEGDPGCRRRFPYWSVYPFLLFEPLQPVRRCVALTRDQRLAETGCQMGCLPARA